MRGRSAPIVGVLLLCMVFLFSASPVGAALILYEPFNYTTGTASGTGVLLNGQGTTGELGMTGTWSTFNTGTANSVTVYQQGTSSNVVNSYGNATLFTGTAGAIAPSGGYAGSLGTGATSNTTDHIEIWRPLDAAVTATFTDGSTTWFSYISACAFNLNARSPSLALGAASLSEDRGNSAFGEAIGAGGMNKNTSGVGTNTLAVMPEYWDSVLSSAGEDEDATQFAQSDNSGSFGVRTSAGDGATAVPSADYMTWERYLPDGLGGYTQYSGVANIIVGKIEWHDGSPDVISVVRFLAGDTISEAAFSAAIAAQPMLSSANWTTTQPDLDQTKFDTISVGGGRYFVDELRLGTQFTDVAPEPATLALLAIGGIGVLARRRRA